MDNIDLKNNSNVQITHSKEFDDILSLENSKQTILKQDINNIKSLSLTVLERIANHQISISFQLRLFIKI